MEGRDNFDSSFYKALIIKILFHMNSYTLPSTIG